MQKNMRTFAGTLVYWVSGDADFKHHSPVLFLSHDDLTEEEKSDGFGDFLCQAMADDEDWYWLTDSNIDYVFNFNIAAELMTQHECDIFKLSNPYTLHL